MYNIKLNYILFIFFGSLGALVQTSVSSSQNFVGNISRLGGFSVMTSSSMNSLGSNISCQLSSQSNMLSHLPPQQVLPSVIDKSLNSSNYY